MEPLIQSVTSTVAQDVRELVRATELETPALIEKEPPNWRWRMPLGFATVVAAGAFLLAAGAVQVRMHEQKQGGRPQLKTRMHKKKLRAYPAPLRG